MTSRRRLFQTMLRMLMLCGACILLLAGAPHTAHADHAGESSHQTECAWCGLHTIGSFALTAPPFKVPAPEGVPAASPAAAPLPAHRRSIAAAPARAPPSPV